MGPAAAAAADATQNPVAIAIATQRARRVLSLMGSHILLMSFRKSVYVHPDGV
jgi:hypothetical protein